MAALDPDDYWSLFDSGHHYNTVAEWEALLAPYRVLEARRSGQMFGNVCHLVPGVDGPRGSLGPSLQGVASRPMISQGTVKNTPPNLVLYLQNPASLNPQSTMPPLGVSADDAKDIAAFLMTLK